MPRCPCKSMGASTCQGGEEEPSDQVVEIASDKEPANSSSKVWDCLKCQARANET